MICKHCGKEFIQTHHAQRYCPDCQKISYYWRNHDKELNRIREMRKKNKTMRICPICNGVFIADKHHHKYCSDECKKEGHKRTLKEWRQTRIDAMYIEFLERGEEFPETVPF